MSKSNTLRPSNVMFSITMTVLLVSYVLFLSSCKGKPVEGAKDIVGDVKLLNKMGEVQGRTGNFDKAIELFNQAVELDPNYAESYNNLGFTYYKKGKYKRAEQFFSKALEIDPNFDKAKSNLNTIRNVIRRSESFEKETKPPVSTVPTTS